MLETGIKTLTAAGASIDREAARAAFAALRDALSAAAGTALTGSTPVYDLVRGARAVSIGKGPEWGTSLSTPVIVKYRDSWTDTRTEFEAWIP